MNKTYISLRLLFAIAVMLAFGCSCATQSGQSVLEPQKAPDKHPRGNTNLEQLADPIWEPVLDAIRFHRSREQGWSDYSATDLDDLPKLDEILIVVTPCDLPKGKVGTWAALESTLILRWSDQDLEHFLSALPEGAQPKRILRLDQLHLENGVVKCWLTEISVAYVDGRARVTWFATSYEVEVVYVKQVKARVFNLISRATR